MSYFLGIDKVDATRIAAIDDQGHQISYGDLVDFCNKMQKEFQERSLVFHFSENSVDSLSYYMACIHAKAVPLLLSPQTDRDLINSLLKTYQPNYIIAPDRICHYFEGAVIKENGDYKLIKLSDKKNQLYE